MEILTSVRDKIRALLNKAKNPVYPKDVDRHTYDDKYTLAEYITNTALMTQLNAWISLGLKREDVAKVCEWQKTRNVTLKFESSVLYSYKSEKLVDDTRENVEIQISGSKTEKSESGTTKSTDWLSKIKKTNQVMEYTYNVQLKYNVYLTDEIEKVIIVDKSEQVMEFRTKSNGLEHLKGSPKKVNEKFEANVTTLFNLLQMNDYRFNFVIDRSSKDCRTPKRNPNIKSVTDFFSNIDTWNANVASFFSTYPEATFISLFFDNEIRNMTQTVDSLMDKVFIPIHPCFNDEEGQQSLIFTAEDMELLFQENKASFQQQKKELEDMFNLKKFVLGLEDYILLLHVKCGMSIVRHYVDSVDYIENLLYDQIIKAIGKELTTKDFEKVILYQNNKLFLPAYRPSPLSFAVRLATESPKGVYGISFNGEPLRAFTRKLQDTSPISFSLNASTKVQCTGEKYLHGFTKYEFGCGKDSSTVRLELEARARQFSSFIILAGNMLSATELDVKAACIVKNKDELTIPLLLTSVPTAKVFKDSIKSLSPEQQEFSKAYRSLQLSSSIFAVLVIQINPQLERVLALPSQCLTKEIQLTQDLMDLFLRYQIPCDLLSYDQDPGESNRFKIDAVKKNVASVLATIGESRKKVLDESKEMRELNKEKDSLQYEEENGSAKKYYARLSMPFSAPGNARSMAYAPTAPMPVMSFPAPTAPIPVMSFAATAAPIPYPKVSGQPIVREKDTVTDAVKPVANLQSKGDSGSNNNDDLTLMPFKLDAYIEKYDEENSLNSATMEIGETWTKNSQKNIISNEIENRTLYEAEQSTEKNQAFDLIDALSKSGGLEIQDCFFHVFLPTTQKFEKSVIDTVIQDNTNPIAIMEKSTIILASTIMKDQASNLVAASEIERLSTSHAKLIQLE